ncbi:hypothetical protein FOZ63_032140, partial [Perkinsus olseni]
DNFEGSPMREYKNSSSSHRGMSITLNATEHRRLEETIPTLGYSCIAKSYRSGRIGTAHPALS